MHAADKTGEAIENALVSRFRKSSVGLFENHIAIDLICSHSLPKRCDGVFVLINQIIRSEYWAKITVLATGGAGKVYLTQAIPMYPLVTVSQWLGGWL